MSEAVFWFGTQLALAAIDHYRNAPATDAAASAAKQRREDDMLQVARVTQAAIVAIGAVLVVAFVARSCKKHGPAGQGRRLGGREEEDRPFHASLKRHIASLFKITLGAAVVTLLLSAEVGTAPPWAVATQQCLFMASLAILLALALALLPISAAWACLHLPYLWRLLPFPRHIVVNGLAAHRLLYIALVCVTIRTLMFIPHELTEAHYRTYAACVDRCTRTLPGWMRTLIYASYEAQQTNLYHLGL